MIVDYHVHLQPDRHVGRCKYTLENLDDYIRQATLAGIQEIGVTEHCNRFRQFMPVMESVMGKEESVPAIDQWTRRLHRGSRCTCSSCTRPRNPAIRSRCP